MDRLALAQSSDHEPGTWRLWCFGGLRHVYIVCPACGREGRLGDRHCVAANGDVDPSVSCPLTDCGFDKFVTLEDWAP